MMHKLGGCALTQDIVRELAPRIREADRMDCKAHDADPETGLIMGLHSGNAWAATWDNEVIGAFGWHEENGTIWSLWAELTHEQSRAAMLRAPDVIKSLVKLAGGPLCNWVRTDNLLTMAWLRASKCFDFVGEPVEHRGHLYRHFITKPLGDL